MREKLLNLMKSEGLTSSRLAEILEIQPSGISHILSGRNKPSFDMLQKILRRFPKIDPDWLILDSDRMYRDGGETTTVGNGSIMDDGLFSSIEHGIAPKATQSIAENPIFGQSTSETGNNAISATIPATGTSKSQRIVVFYSDGTYEDYLPKNCGK